MKVLMHIIQMKSPGSMGPDPWNTSAAIKSQIVFSRSNIEDIPVGILCMNSPYGMEIQYCTQSWFYEVRDPKCNTVQ